MQDTPPTAASLHPRAGLTLLEVLVAGGILAVGLASVSALLPAASARLGQATQQDRAGVLAANARAECMNRGLVAADVFSSGTLACVFGELRDMLRPGVTGSASAALVQRTGTSTSPTFQLPDDPVFRWGGMLAPASGSAAPGMPATLSIAVFRRPAATTTVGISPGISSTITLTGTSTSPRFQLTTGSANGLVDEATRRRFLSACSHVLALTSPPRWARVTSSWTMPGFVIVNGTITSGTENVGARRSFVVLDPNPLTSGSTTVAVIGFDGLVRVDQYPVTLD